MPTQADIRLVSLEISAAKLRMMTVFKEFKMAT
jgi:hypothetical protein